MEHMYLWFKLSGRFFPHFQEEVSCLIVTPAVQGVPISSSCALITTFWIHKSEPRLVIDFCTLATMFPRFGLPLNFVCMFSLALFDTSLCVFMTTLCISNHESWLPCRLVFFKRKPHMVCYVSWLCNKSCDGDSLWKSMVHISSM